MKTARIESVVCFWEWTDGRWRLSKTTVEDADGRCDGRRAVEVIAEFAYSEVGGFVSGRAVTVWGFNYGVRLCRWNPPTKPPEWLPPFFAETVCKLPDWIQFVEYGFDLLTGTADAARALIYGGTK